MPAPCGLSQPIAPGLPQPPRSGRRTALLALTALAGGLGAAATRAADPASAEPRPLLVLGDSLSAEYGLPRGTGWVALLERRLAQRRPPLRVVNASISGETTSGGRARLPALLAKHRPGIVVIELGGNDALRGLPLTVSEANLREMVRASNASGARTLLLGMRMPPNYGRAYAEQFEAVFRRVADAERVPLVPSFLDAFGDRFDHFQPDRIHPAERAQPLMLDAVWPTLSKLL